MSVTVLLTTISDSDWLFVKPWSSCTVSENVDVAPAELTPKDIGKSARRAPPELTLAALLSGANGPSAPKTRTPSVSAGTSRSLCRTTTTCVSGSRHPASATSNDSDNPGDRILGTAGHVTKKQKKRPARGSGPAVGVAQVRASKPEP